ncbi:hypothetical protein EGI22_18375 [Lacihabitans sp. LS3-19]|uniref:hypothetical protein n=1 Tax=Lacihabitans sp. LS3-19 TaxID=2487335 RepID=UPI0020CF9085|nr:hypothetical protein [Lacihabitans sp. LS3-19]MCP9769875.1 hypothetical protein [Lacihabitans sp. LS3-19]
MRTNDITLYFSNPQAKVIENFEEAFFDVNRKYSLHQVPLVRGLSEESLTQALQDCLKVCQLAGINSKHHFCKIYIYDEQTNSLLIEWKMTQKGLNLLLMQMPLLNENIAKCYWEMAE